MIRHLEHILLIDVLNALPRSIIRLPGDTTSNAEDEVQFIVYTEVAGIHRGVSPEVCSLFDQVEMNTRLPVVIPVSSTGTENGFSGLWRLKTWLCSAVQLTFLNSVKVCQRRKKTKVGTNMLIAPTPDCICAFFLLTA